MRTEEKMSTITVIKYGSISSRYCDINLSWNIKLNIESTPNNKEPYIAFNGFHAAKYN